MARPIHAQIVWNSLSVIIFAIVAPTSPAASSKVTIAGSQLRIPSFGMTIGSSSQMMSATAKPAA